jgi:hypothetical protein
MFGLHIQWDIEQQCLPHARRRLLLWVKLPQPE